MGACRVHKDNACHLLAAYEEALTNPHQGSISHLPFDTRGLQGISTKSLHQHITGALLPIVFYRELGWKPMWLQNYARLTLLKPKRWLGSYLCGSFLAIFRLSSRLLA